VRFSLPAPLACPFILLSEFSTWYNTSVRSALKGTAATASQPSKINHLPNSRSKQRLVLLGVLFIFGGEAFCILGPMRYERVVHFSCHAVFYTGVALVSIGALLHWAGKRSP
jgi:hypothetical protein